MCVTLRDGELLGVRDHRHLPDFGVIVAVLVFARLGLAVEVEDAAAARCALERLLRHLPRRIARRPGIFAREADTARDFREESQVKLRICLDVSRLAAISEEPRDIWQLVVAQLV